MESEKKYWFPAKPPGYGWGWGLPITWQGWAVFIGYLLIVIGGAIVLVPRSMPVFLGFVTVAMAALIGIFKWKGEPLDSPSRPAGKPDA